MFSLIPAAALIAAAPAAMPATLVHHADLDLSTEHGRAVLDRRIARAARSVCQAESRLSPQLTGSARRCARETIAATHAARERLIAAAGTVPISVAVR